MSKTRIRLTDELLPGDVLVGNSNARLTVTGQSPLSSPGVRHEIVTVEFGSILASKYKAWQVERVDPVPAYKVGTLVNVRGQVLIRLKDEWQWLTEEGKTVETGIFPTDDKVRKELAENVGTVEIIFGGEVAR